MPLGDAIVAMGSPPASESMAMSLAALFPDFYRGLYDAFRSGWGHEPTANEWLGTIIAFGVVKWIGIWLILLWRPLRLALTPRSIKAGRARSRAIDLFKVGTEAKTRTQARTTAQRCRRDRRSRTM